MAESLSFQGYHTLIRNSVFFLSLLFVSSLLLAEQEPLQESPVVIVSYNVENYLSMPRWINGRFRNNAGKPESEKRAVATILSKLHPDIIGLMEIGDLRQVHDLERHLHEVGLDYPYQEYLHAWDQERHLLLLSRFPFVECHSQAIFPISINGKVEHSPRGILDVTVALRPDYKLRLLCVHFKSKISVPNYNQDSFRAAEALSLRNYVNAIMASDPKTHLLVMGDFNDTKNSKSLVTLLGKPKKPEILHVLNLTDDRGENWTEYWKEADLYSRIDYMLINKELESSIVQEHSGIARPALWKEASDHCPLFTEILPQVNALPTPLPSPL
ncbi:MAG: endonuclease/exonuclease/phosphatase family protein [Chthoniobacterales bacterium]|nr:endonuclease/exonuclease/phosphatase family protein [Chthoniobacterales bacterium]